MYEYRRRPLHGKVAVMDDHWATVGSSNLDPLSLSLNLEANLIIHDRQFNQTLRDNLEQLIAADCVRVDEAKVPQRTWWNAGAKAWWCSTSCAISRRWSAGCLRIRRSWRRWIRRYNPKWKPRTALKRKKERNPDVQNDILAGGWRKNPHLAVLYCGGRAAGGLRAEGGLGRGVEGHPQL